MTDVQFWDRLAERYAAQPVKDPAAFERKKQITRADLSPDAIVLELGCGTGSLALEMARHAGHIHAVDVSAEMIRIAEGKKAAQAVGNVTFHVGTLAAALPHLPAQLDAVWAYSILHLVEDRQATLQQAFDVLKPGGTFIASNVCIGAAYRPLLAVMRWLGKAPRVYFYDRRTIARELADAGFVDITEKDVGADKTVAFVLAKKPS